MSAPGGGSDAERVRELEAELRWLNANLQASREEIDRLQGLVALLEGSAALRATRPLRAYLARHPRQRLLVRRLLRASLRVAALRQSGGPSVSSFVQDPDLGYESWVALYDTLGGADRMAMEAYLERLPRLPVVSVLLPVSAAPVELVRATVDSLGEQVYARWELCASDDGSSSPAVRSLLAAAAAEDDRVRLVDVDRAAGAAAAANAAAALAGGEYVALVEPGCILRPHALLLVADEANRHPEAVLLYSDEDELDAEGRRRGHWFKPDWNPALALSQHYLRHLTVIRRDRFDDLGGFREGFDGGHDRDLVLRATDEAPPGAIRHVPHVLCHVRRGGWKRPGDGGEAARRAVEDALARRGVEATVESLGGGRQRVRYAVPEPQPRIDVVMPSACRLELLRPCLEGLLHGTRYANLGVTLVVNEIRRQVPEQARFLDEIEHDPRVRVHLYDDRPFNFSWLNNVGVGGGDAPLVLLMNDDLLVIHEDWLEAMVGHVLQDGVAAVGAKLYFPDETIQHGGVILGFGGVAVHYHLLEPRATDGYHGRAVLDQDLSCVTAGCMLLRREAFEQVGGLDEELAVAFNDVDLCLRLVSAGWRIVWTPSAELYHRESASLGRHDAGERREEFDRETRLVVARWGERLLRDPHYNPNLALERFENTPSFPPRVDYPWRARPERRTASATTP